MLERLRLHKSDWNAVVRCVANFAHPRLPRAPRPHPPPPPYSPTHLPYRPPAVVGFISAKQFEHKAGAFAEEAEKSDLVLEATKRWDAYVGRVAADLKHHSWASILGALPEDGS